MLQSGVQQMRLLQGCERQKPRATDYASILSLLCEIFADCVLLNTELEHSRARLVLKCVIILFSECSIKCDHTVNELEDLLSQLSKGEQTGSGAWCMYCSIVVF